MEIIKHPKTGEEWLVWFWQKYITGESRIDPATKRITFIDRQPRNEQGRYLPKVSATLPQVRGSQPRIIPVHDFLQGDYTFTI